MSGRRRRLRNIVSGSTTLFFLSRAPNDAFSQKVNSREIFQTLTIWFRRFGFPLKCYFFGHSVFRSFGLG
jgi:hypothetical protein